MDVASPGRVFAQSRFEVQADQPKVWDLLAMVIYQELPLEQVDIVSLDRFRARLVWRLGFIRFPLFVEGELVDTLRPESYGCVLSVRRGPVRIGVRVTLKLRAVGKDLTEVSCTAVEDGKGSLLGPVLRRFQRDFARKTFDSIRGRIQRLCS